MTQLIKTITKVKKQINPKLQVDGILLTLVDGRTNLAKAYENFSKEVFLDGEKQRIKSQSAISR